MVTLKINVVALIVAGIAGFIFYTLLKSHYGNVEMALIAVHTVAIVRIYDGVAGIPAFKEKKSEKKEVKK